MSTEEKLKALKVVALLKDEVEANLHELDAIEVNKIRRVSLNNGSDIELDDVASKRIWYLLHTMLTQKHIHLLERAKELMK